MFALIICLFYSDVLFVFLFYGDYFANGGCLWWIFIVDEWEMFMVDVDVDVYGG